MFWFFGTYIEFKDNPTLSFWWLFNRIQAKLVIRYQLSVIGYQLLQQNCTCFYLLLSVLLIIIIILYFLTPVIIITPHYNYSAILIMILWWFDRIISAHYLQTDSLWNMNYAVLLALPLLKELLQQHSGLIWKENLQFWLSDPLSTTVCKLAAVIWKISCLTPFSDNQGPEISCSRKAWGFWKSCGLNLSPNVHGL